MTEDQAVVEEQVVQDVNFEVDFNDAETERFANGGNTPIAFNTCMRAIVKYGEKSIAGTGSLCLSYELIPLVGDYDAGEELSELAGAKLNPERLYLPFTNPHHEGHSAPNTMWRLENFVLAEVDEDDVPNKKDDKLAYTQFLQRRGKAYWADPLELKDTIVYIVTNTEAQDTWTDKKTGQENIRSWRGIGRVSHQVPKGLTVATTAEEIFG